MKIIQTVLLIEDDLAIIETIRTILSSTISTIERILVAHTMAEGLDILRDSGIDLVILDPGLPDSMGLNSMRRVRQVSPQAPIIIFTGSNDTRIAIAAERLGIRYLSKSAFIDGHLVMLPFEMRLAMIGDPETVVPLEAEEADFDIADIKDFYQWRGGIDTRLTNVDVKLTSIVTAHSETCRNLLAAKEDQRIMFTKMFEEQSKFKVEVLQEMSKNRVEYLEADSKIKVQIAKYISISIGATGLLGYVGRMLKLW